MGVRTAAVKRVVRSLARLVSGILTLVVILLALAWLSIQIWPLGPGDAALSAQRWADNVSTYSFVVSRVQNGVSDVLIGEVRPRGKGSWAVYRREGAIPLGMFEREDGVWQRQAYGMEKPLPVGGGIETVLGDTPARLAAKILRLGQNPARLVDLPDIDGKQPDGRYQAGQYQASFPCSAITESGPALSFYIEGSRSTCKVTYSLHDNHELESLQLPLGDDGFGHVTFSISFFFYPPGKSTLALELHP